MSSRDAMEWYLNRMRYDVDPEIWVVVGAICEILEHILEEQGAESD